MLIAHLTDPHLRPTGHLYQGLVDSNALFEAAVRQVNALDPAPDVVVLTGDLVDEGSPAEYAAAGAALAAIRAPLLVIPGNHDDRNGLRDCLGEHLHLPSAGPLHFAVGDLGPVRIVALDVTVPGEHHGEADAAALGWLDATLAAEPQRPTLLLMHQPPFVSGIDAIDAYNCRGGAALAAVLRRHPQVERVLAGHVHRFMTVAFGGTIAVTAPSTATAIALRLAPAAEPASYLEPPGFLLHQWSPERALVTHLMPTGRFPGPFAFF